MPQKSWAVGEEVLAADFNSYLQNQVIPQFTGTAQRDAQWTAPPNGAMCITTDTNTLWQRKNAAWEQRDQTRRVLAGVCVGTAPSATATIVTKIGTATYTTNAGGSGSIALPAPAFTTGIVAIFLMHGDSAQGVSPYAVIPVLASCTLTTIATFHPGTANTAVRVNYQVVGA